MGRTEGEGIPRDDARCPPQRVSYALCLHVTRTARFLWWGLAFARQSSLSIKPSRAHLDEKKKRQDTCIPVPVSAFLSLFCPLVNIHCLIATHMSYSALRTPTDIALRLDTSPDAIRRYHHARRVSPVPATDTSG
ncbi:hypothetical protein LX32DRAFT_277712 [Colletotrichum zoysiae]|uniref:Uncharacterized protein n=1 Tax=Colletotrichum zoysiae TaxID=1216348 RepID=A0AAD9LWQ1_9PEZI|nr:hypothetical protein LX32DRAFT_277712 [Colletotrichum zoysiae]